MDFWFVVAQSITLFASPMMIEVLYSRKLSRKQLILWNAQLVVVSIISMNLQYEGAELSILLSALPIAMLSTLSLNVILTKKFLGFSWGLSFVLGCVSTSLYRVVYVIIVNVLTYIFPEQLGLGIDYGYMPLYALKYLWIGLIIYASLFLLSLNIRKRAERNNLVDILEDYPISITDIILAAYLLVFIMTIGRLFVWKDTVVYAFGIVFSMSVACFLFCRSALWTRKKSIEQQVYFENLRQYRNSVTMAHREMLDFKMKYQNIVLNLDRYIESEDLAELSAYYEKIVSTSDIELSNYTKKLGTISNIKEDFIKGILFSKQAEAQKKNISFTIKVLERFQTDIKKPVKLIRILGNLVDNAMDAAEIAAEKRVDLVFFVDGEGQRKIIISNSRQQEKIELTELHQRGKTLKENHTGIGLSNIAKLCDSEIQVEFKLLEDQFVSIVTIY